ncbi:MAG: GNAT family N-acetyltransferase [Acidimicrobiia bacterium]
MTWTDSLDSRYIGALGAPSDLTEACELVMRADTAVRGTTFMSMDFLETILSEPGFDRAADVITVTERSTGELIAFARFTQRDPYVSSETIASVDPDHVGRGVGGAIIEWGLARANTSIDRAPEGTRVTTALFTNNLNERAKRLFTRKGFAVARYFLEMEIVLDEPVEVSPLPPGITLRTLRSDEDTGALSAAVDDAFRDHYGYTKSSPELDAARWKNWRSSEAWDDELVWLAERDGALVGMNVCIRDHGSRTNYGYVATLGVLPEARGLGLARCMLTTSFAEYQQRGKEIVALHVDADSITGATRLYTGVGMHEVQTEVDFEREIRPGTDLVVR